MRREGGKEREGTAGCKTERRGDTTEHLADEGRRGSRRDEDKKGRKRREGKQKNGRLRGEEALQRTEEGKSYRKQGKTKQGQKRRGKSVAGEAW